MFLALSVYQIDYFKSIMSQIGRISLYFSTRRCAITQKPWRFLTDSFTTMNLKKWIV